MSKIRKIIAILLIVLFVVTVTAGAVSARWGPDTQITSSSGKAPLKSTDKSTGSPTSWTKTVTTASSTCKKCA